MIINEKLYNVCQSHPANGYEFSSVFGNQTRFPDADVLKLCKYFDPDLCSQLIGLSRAFIPCTLNRVLLLWNGEGSNVGYESPVVAQTTAIFRLHHVHSLSTYSQEQTQPDLLASFPAFHAGSLRGYM